MANVTYTITSNANGLPVENAAVTMEGVTVSYGPTTQYTNSSGQTTFSVTAGNVFNQTISKTNYTTIGPQSLVVNGDRAISHTLTYELNLVTVTATSGITPVEAQFNAQVYIYSGDLDVNFAYKKSSDSTWTNLSGSNYSSTQTISETISTLEPNISYDVKAVFDSTDSNTDTFSTIVDYAKLVLGANSYLITKPLTKGNTYGYFTVFVGETTGSYTIEISGDNGINWQSVTEESRTAFNNSDDSGVLVKINSETGATITPEYNSDGSLKKPGLRVKLE
jgi:hypothetical protein